MKTDEAAGKIMIKRYDDNVMVGGLPTDIVIPYDSILQSFITIVLTPISELWAQPELGKALYAPCDLESLFSRCYSACSSSTLFSGEMPWPSGMV